MSHGTDLLGPVANPNFPLGCRTLELQDNISIRRKFLRPDKGSVKWKYLKFDFCDILKAFCKLWSLVP
jgi:hypothetical protein